MHRFLLEALLVFYLLAALFQLSAWWFLFGKLGFKTTARTPHPLLSQSPVSIIVCARNEAGNLRRHLPEWLAQRFSHPWELLVVDDASEDETPEVLRSFQEENPGRIRVFRVAEKTSAGKKFALSQGIAVAKYDHLLLTDADCAPASPYWLAHMAAALDAKPETEIVLGYGPIRESNLTTFKKLSNFHITGLWSRYETAFVAAQYLSFALAGMPYMGVGRNLAFKRALFDRVGGFAAHAHIPSGDDDLFVNAAANARNTAVCLDPESFVYSDPPKNWSAWFRQKQRHLSASPAYRWPHKIMLGALGLSHAGFYGSFLVLLAAGSDPMLVSGVFLLRLVSVLYIFGKVLHIFREPGLWWRIPVLDPLMAVYTGAVVPWLLMGKNKGGWK